MHVSTSNESIPTNKVDSDIEIVSSAATVIDQTTQKMNAPVEQGASDHNVSLSIQTECLPAVAYAKTIESAETSAMVQEGAQKQTIQGDVDEQIDNSAENVHCCYKDALIAKVTSLEKASSPHVNFNLCLYFDSQLKFEKDSLEVELNALNILNAELYKRFKMLFKPQASEMKNENEVNKKSPSNEKLPQSSQQKPPSDKVENGGENQEIQAEKNDVRSISVPFCIV